MFLDILETLIITIMKINNDDINIKQLQIITQNIKQGQSKTKQHLGIQS